MCQNAFSNPHIHVQYFNINLQLYIFIHSVLFLTYIYIIYNIYVYVLVTKCILYKSDSLVSLWQWRNKVIQPKEQLQDQRWLG